ncbi:NF-kappa-B inhibitor zeta-like [Branchiostoma floridae]|uniref:NF-kappa-B inhibitor zeta-like n=1 Tax=Branchiostoma floridae TaxID=7739 RepID=A0A9J7LTJ5_BRAFL|nr:NF-kappa-B inhibitor zeta-like [Branchiostoma floridae]
MLSWDVVADDSGVDSPGSSLGSPTRHRTAMSHDDSAPSSPGSPGSCGPSSPPDMKIPTERQVILNSRGKRRNTVKSMLIENGNYPYPNQGSPQNGKQGSPRRYTSQASPPNLLYLQSTVGEYPVVVNTYSLAPQSQMPPMNITSSAWPEISVLSPSSTLSSTWPQPTVSNKVMLPSSSISSSCVSSDSTGHVTSQSPQVAVVTPSRSIPLESSITPNDNGAVDLILALNETYAAPNSDSAKPEYEKPDIGNSAWLQIDTKALGNGLLDNIETFDSVDSGYTSIKGGSEGIQMLFDTESPYNPQGTSTPKWSPPQTTASVVAPPSGTVSPPKTFSSKNGLSMGIMQEVTLANTTTTSLPSYTLPLYETEFRAPKGPPTTMYIPPGGKVQQRPLIRPSQLGVNSLMTNQTLPPYTIQNHSLPSAQPHNSGPVSQPRPTSRQSAERSLPLARQISQEIPKDALLHQDDDGDTYLTIVVMQGNCDVVQAVAEQMVSLNLSLDIPDKHGKTALMLAVMEKRGDMVYHLVRLGADVNKQDKEGRTALHFIAVNGAIEVLECLYKACKEEHKEINMDCKNYQGLTALHCALMESGHCQGQLKQLPRAQSITNVPGTFMETREKQVLRGKQQKLQQVVKAMLVMGASPRCQDAKSGRTGLHHAVQSCSTELVELLLFHYHNADIKHKFVNQTTYNGNTALHAAVGLQDDGRADIVRLIAKNGADQSIRNDENDRAIDLVKKEDTAVRSILGGGKKFRN